MSGIFGVWYLDNRPVDSAVLQRMSGRLAHRGPDRVGTWCGPSVGFGHRMLHTTPESLIEVQPLALGGGALAITADARVDNREELCALLGVRSGPERPVTDSELILAAYEKWGEQCPERIIGDFAFVIWDGRTRQLFCARDPMGVKPFYYYRSDRVFVFASEIKGLLCAPEVPRRLNEVQVALYLDELVVDPTMTFYQGVCRLPAAHSMSLGAERATSRRYWLPDIGRKITCGSDEQFAEEFHDLFTEAVRCRLRSARPIGSMLSGGLDSSSIVCTARSLLEQRGAPPLHTFSAIFPSLPPEDLKLVDERRFMHAVTSTGGMIPHFVRADESSPLRDLDRVLESQDEAPLAYNLYMTWGLFEEAQRQGVRVCLDGTDGDTTVGDGWLLLTELIEAGQWAAFEEQVTAIGKVFGVRPRSVLNRHVLPYVAGLASAGEWRRWVRATAGISRSLGVPKTAMLIKYGVGPRVPASMKRALRKFRGDGAEQPSWVDAGFARRVGLEEHRRSLESAGVPWVASSQEAHWGSLSGLIWPATLELADKAAAVFGLEPRYPFFDRRLIEFCLALPMGQRLDLGWTRVILRRAMRGILPEEVRHRVGKQDLSPNYVRGLRENDRALLDAAILQPGPLGEYADLPALRAAYDRFVSDRVYLRRDSTALYRAAVLARWLGVTTFA